MSDHSIPLRWIDDIRPHPNADKLSIVTIDNADVIVRTEDWAKPRWGVHIPPDFLVPQEHVPFLASRVDLEGYVRITPMTLRGIRSYGVLLPYENLPSAVSRDNMMDTLGIKRYEPPVRSTCSGQPAIPPQLPVLKYQLHNYEKCGNSIKDGDEVCITEKIHGTSSRYVFHNGTMYAGSRTEWLQKHENSAYWQVLEFQPEIEEFCRANPNIILYGEVYGSVQSLKYDIKSVRFVAFDIMNDGKWLSHADARQLGRDLPWVPVLYEGPFNKGKLEFWREGTTVLGNKKHIREGIVIELLKNPLADQLERVKLKCVADAYYKKRESTYKVSLHTPGYGAGDITLQPEVYIHAHDAVRFAKTTGLEYQIWKLVNR